MQGTKVASRYAKSLLDLSLEKGQLDKVYADMKNVRQACKENRDLSLVLKSPIIKGDKKEQVLKAIFKDASEITFAFFGIIIRKNREYALEEIAHSFVEQYKTHKKILTAVITTAFGLDDDLRNKVLEVVKKSANSEVELVEKVDKNIIGGFIIQVGDKQDDTSIRSKIMKLNRAFSENQFVSKH
ncbi:MAG TPA: ATP synthase F1 subunit delta [Bacteroidia bacterium]|jgi:F-type H+-transporting ATPase subunit delta